MFAKEGVYPAAGIFSAAHLIGLSVCIVLIALAVYFTRRISLEGLRKITFGVAILITALELFKIVVYKFIICGYEVSALDQWFPLYFCSLFIYFAWMSAFPGTHWTKYGDAFLSVGCITGGAAFLCYPATSATMAPIWHFLCLHSMLYHSLMVYLGVLFLLKSGFKPTKKHFTTYVLAFAMFAIPALVMNATLDTNMMMMGNAYRLPKFVEDIYNWSHTLYTCAVILVYILVPYGVSSLIWVCTHRKKGEAKSPK